MNNLEIKDILTVISGIAKSTKYKRIFNERYLHHYFSHQLLEMYNCLDLSGEREIKLHPEWPTSKKDTNLRRRYKKGEPSVNGTEGHLDFVIGDYEKPDIGIEFSLQYKWSHHEEIVFDFLKLLDKENPFKVSVSFNIVFRHRKLVEGKNLENFKDSMNKAYIEAEKRLGGDVSGNREVYFIITEIAQNNERRHWFFDERNDRRFANDPSSRYIKGLWLS